MLPLLRPTMNTAQHPRQTPHLRLVHPAPKQPTQALASAPAATQQEADYTRSVWARVAWGVAGFWLLVVLVLSF